ncbi:MAG: hypothetical protein P4M15_06125 [Alphaproteobacteria bacterium]|nr:hypothetical protein [Alphaproteobacteria bacterium]
MTALPEPHPHRWHDHRVVTFDGMFDTHATTGEDYATRTMADLFDVRPACCPKERGPAFIPSTYADHDARSHTAQRAHGSFVALTADIDHGDHAPGDLVAAIKAFAGPAAALIYSSPHARPGDRRWRVIVPLAEPVPYALWHDAQTALCDHLDAHGIAPDRALCRAAQPVFLPNVPRVHAKTGATLRGQDGQPLFFAWRSTGIDAPGLSLDRGPVVAGMARVARQRAEAEGEREKLRIETLRRPAANSDDPVAAFNHANAITDLLARYGYDKRPGSNDWRSPHQTGETFATRIMGDKWFSLSGSDAAAGLGSICPAGCFGDAFDLFAHFEHGGNRRAAFRALVQEARS